MAYGVGRRGSRGLNVVKEPVLAPGRTPISNQRGGPVNATAPKSSVTTNIPLFTGTSSRTLVLPNAPGPVSLSRKTNCKSYTPLAGDPASVSLPQKLKAVPWARVAGELRNQPDAATSVRIVDLRVFINVRA